MIEGEVVREGRGGGLVYIVVIHGMRHILVWPIPFDLSLMNAFSFSLLWFGPGGDPAPCSLNQEPRERIVHTISLRLPLCYQQLLEYSFTHKLTTLTYVHILISVTFDLPRKQKNRNEKSSLNSASKYLLNR